MADKDYFLEVENIGKSFSTVKVLDSVSFKLKQGKILGICGENGAGKSTLMNILGGVYKHDSGEMYIQGEKYTPANALDAKKAGIAFIHQELNLFPNLSVRQNFMIEDIPQKGIWGLIDRNAIKDIATGILAELGEEIDIDTIVEDLTIGQRQMVEIAKEVAKKANIVIFDEPTTSLSNKEKENLFRVIRKLVSDGKSIIYISHILDDVFELCDKVMVLRDGIMAGNEEIGSLSKEKVIKMMVGRELKQIYPYQPKTAGEEMLRVEKLNQGKRLKDISFSLRQGEIVGLFGLMGAGRSEMANAIFGLDRIDSGKVYVFGKEVKHINPIKLIEKGMAYITENRREEGLLIPKSVNDNLSLSYINKTKHKLSFVDRKKENEETGIVIEILKIKTFDKIRQKVRMLSGGNQQKVVLGKWMLTKPRIFLLDEPTRGIDVGSKHEIYTLINKLVQNDSTVLFISSEMEELMGVCDRIMIMRAGRIVGQLDRKEYERETFIRLAIEGEKDNESDSCPRK